MKIPLKSVLREMYRRGISFANPYKGASKFNREIEAIEKWLKSDDGKFSEILEEMLEYVRESIKLREKYETRIIGKAKSIKNPELKIFVNENVQKFMKEIRDGISGAKLKYYDKMYRKHQGW